MGLVVSNLRGCWLTRVGEGQLRQTTVRVRSKKLEIPEYQRVTAGWGVVRVEFGLRTPPRIYIHNPLDRMFNPILPSRRLLMRGFSTISRRGGGSVDPPPNTGGLTFILYQHPPLQMSIFSCTFAVTSETQLEVGGDVNRSPTHESGEGVV